MIPKECKELYAKNKKYARYVPLVLGVTLLLNYYFLKLPWGVILGWILFLAGLLKIIATYWKKHKKK